MAKSKYNRKLRIKAGELAEKGCTDKEIIEGLQIGKNTFYSYLKKYEDFQDAIKKGRESSIADVEASLFKKAVGYDVTETTEYKDKDGNIERTVTKTKHIPPDTAAMIFYLTNKAYDRWINGMRKEIDREPPELKTIIVEVAPPD